MEFGFQNRYGFFIAFADSALDRILYVMIFAKLIAVKKSWSNAKTAKTFFDTISSFLSLIFSLGVEKVVTDLPSHSEPCVRFSPHTAPSLTVPLLRIQLDFLWL
ncbi:hypothetical protein, partial [Microcystis aeruginosa]|uniref:hypothetical protein n=1 Tax=Microcystis aeruginosa TaxID=1126 RepID=UPI001C20BDFF